VAPRMEDTLTLAALTQCLTRMLWRRTRDGKPWPTVENFFIGENRWRAQRYGVGQGFIDFGRQEIIPCAQAVDEILELIAEDARALDCEAQVEAARGILERGTSSDQQRAIFTQVKEDGADDKTALNSVVQSLIDDFLVGTD